MESIIKSTKISEDIWQFNEPNAAGPYVDAYLIIGESRALLVDSLQTAEDLYDCVREVTDLPLDVVITHGHGDHAGASLKHFVEAGINIYMNMLDFDGLNQGFDGGFQKSWFTDCYHGMTFDLGKYNFEVIMVPGHTKGSLVLLDRENKLMFSGDTIGSGHFWMQIPTATSLYGFSMGLEALYEETKDIKGLLIYPGHRNQSPVQLTEQYIKDTRTITNGLITGVMEGEDAVLDIFGMHMEYKHIGYGMMVDFCYNPKAIMLEDPSSPIGKIRGQFTEETMQKDSVALKYMFFQPAVRGNEKYPLVIYLHGGGERGSYTPLVLANSGATAFADSQWQEENPCYIVAPQCPMNSSWNNPDFQELLVSHIMQLSGKYPIDTCRVYITGLSMGGMGTWEAITRYPATYAAAMPICGGADPYKVRAAKNVPVWAFHAEDDPVVPVSGEFAGPNTTEKYVGTRRIVASLRNEGSDILYTEYPKGYMVQKAHAFAHASWIPAYEDMEAKQWLFNQTRYDKYDIQFIKPGLFYIEDFNSDSIYVVEGKDKALVIDTGLGGGDFISMVKTLTKLPLELAVTHAHLDHMMNSDCFDKFYLSEREMPLFDHYMESMPRNTSVIEDVMPIKDGDIIDLGGGVEIEVLELPGHTPGSVVFIDRSHNACFTGDALGVWMQLPHSCTISEFHDALVRFDKKLQEPGYDKLAFFGGHRRQEGGIYPYGNAYKPNGPERVRDMIKLCEMILNDEIKSAVYPISPSIVVEKPSCFAEYNGAAIVYNRTTKR